MYKQNIKFYGEVLDNYLEINTPLNMEIQDFLKDYVPTKFKKYSSTFDRRKNVINKCDYDITLNFANFLVTSLNNALRGRVNYNNPAMKNAYFTKKLQQKEFGITYYNIQNVMCFTITEVPVSKIGKILSKKRIFKNKNKNKHSDEKYADLSIDWLGFNLDRKDNLSKSEREAVKNISIKTYGVRNGFMATTVDAQMAFKDLPEEENVFSLFSGVINHMIYTQMLRDISERFNKSKNENTLLMEEKILKGIFIKNTMILDGFRDLAQKDFEMHPAMWRAAFESLTYGDVPFFQNFKLSHVAGIDKFYGQVYRNLKIMEDEFADYSDEYKEKALQQWRGVFSNLVSDRVLFADIAAIEEISNVFSLLKTKARIFSNYEEDVLSSSLNTMYSVMKTDAKRFLLTYGFNVNKIDSYMPSVNEDISNVLLHELIPLEQKNIIMKKSAQIDIKEIYKACFIIVKNQNKYIFI